MTNLAIAKADLFGIFPRMYSWRLTNSVRLLLALGLCACGPIAITKGAPRPNVDVEAGGKKMSLEIGSGVQDAFTIPETATVVGAEVTGWHGTLRSGYDTGFGNSFDEGNDFKLSIRRADLDLALGSVTGEGIVGVVRAHLTYQARVLDAQGDTVCRSSATAISKKTFAVPSEATAVAADAVSSMYEKIAADCFSGPLGSARESGADKSDAKSDDSDDDN